MASLYAAAVLFAMASGFVKVAAGFYGGYFVSGFRFLTGAVLCLAFILRKEGRIKAIRPGLVLARGAFGSVSMAMTYAAISLTGPGRATLLSNVYPVFVAIAGALFFGEKAGRRTWLALAACTAGALVVMGDGSGSSLPGDALALGSAVLAGVAVNFVRKGSQYDSPAMLYLSPCLLGLPVIALGLPQAYARGFDALGLAACAGVGILAFAAQSLMVRGYKTIPASRGAVVFYLETGLTVLIGMALGERPNTRFFAGLAAIAAGLWINGAPSFRKTPEKNPVEGGPAP